MTERFAREIQIAPVEFAKKPWKERELATRRFTSCHCPLGGPTTSESSGDRESEKERER